MVHHLAEHYTAMRRRPHCTQLVREAHRRDGNRRWTQRNAVSGGLGRQSGTQGRGGSNSRRVLPTAPQAGRPSRHWPIWAWGEPASCFTVDPLLTTSSCSEVLSGVSLPFPRLPPRDPVTSQRPRLPATAHCGLGFNHGLPKTQTFDLQQTHVA